MTQLQQLKNEKRNFKHQMFLTRPLRGYLGNQYHHWQSEYDKVNKKIKELKTS